MLDLPIGVCVCVCVCVCVFVYRLDKNVSTGKEPYEL